MDNKFKQLIDIALLIKDFKWAKELLTWSNEVDDYTIHKKPEERFGNKYKLIKKKIDFYVKACEGYDKKYKQGNIVHLKN